MSSTDNIQIDYRPYKTEDNTNKFAFGEVMKLQINSEHFYYLFNQITQTGKYIPSVTGILHEAAPIEYGLREFWKLNTKEAGEELFEATGARGLKLHDAVERMLEGEELDLQEDYQTPFEKRALVAWKRWFSILKPNDIKAEYVVASEKYGVAGTIDLKCRVSRRDAAIALNPDRYLEIVPINSSELKIGLKYSKKYKMSVLQADIEQGIITEPDKQEWWIIDNKFASGVRYSHGKQIQAYYELDKESFGETEAAQRLGIILPTAKNKWGYRFVEFKPDFQPFLNIYNTYLDLHDGVLPMPNLEMVWPSKLKLYDRGEKAIS